MYFKKHYLWGLIVAFLLCWCFSQAHAENKEKETGVSTSGSGEKIPLGVRQFVHMVYENNFEIIYKKHDWDIASEKATKEWSIFEPDFVVSYNHGEGLIQNTAEEYYDRLGRDVFDDRTTIYKASVEGLLPTGTQITLSGAQNDTSNYLVEQKYGSLTDNEYDTSFTIQLTQPLLKNAWVPVTMSNIRLAEADRDISCEEYRKEIMQIMARALNVYWEFYYTLKQCNIYGDSVRIAQNLLSSNRERVKEGKIAKTELYESKAGLALRRFLFSAAEQKVEEVRNAMYIMLAESRQQVLEGYVPIDSPSFSDVCDDLSYDQSLEKAFSNSPDYLFSLKKAAEEDIKVAYAKNQRLPQVDLKGSYALNGLDTSSSNSWSTMKSGDYKTWSVGVELRIPLGMGIDTKSDLRAAKFRKRQAVLRVKSMEVNLKNNVDTAIKKVLHARDQLKEHTENVEMMKKLLDVEMKGLEAGRSSSQMVLEREKGLNKARRGKLRAEVDLEKAGINLMLREGSLLEAYGVDVKCDASKQKDG